MRLRENQIAPAFFIGLGGCGGCIVDELARKVKQEPSFERYKDLIHFFALDTDTDDLARHKWIDSGNKFILSDFDKPDYVDLKQGKLHAKPDERIRELLAEHPNAKLWLSGHTHSPLGVRGLITRAKLGRRRSILAINSSALVGVGKTRDPSDPLCSLYLTHRPGRIEVRCRDHRAGEWRKLRGSYVTALSVANSR